MDDELNRRSFVNLSAAYLAGLAAAEAGFGQTASSGKVVRLAFVGVGNRGSYHLDCALGIDGVDVVAVCDVDDKALYRAKRWVEEAGQPSPRLYGESKTAYQALCEKETVDCVICCTPWEYHAAVCLAAMKSGKNAVSEVPIIQTVQEAWQLVEVHESTKRPPWAWRASATSR
jgi:predicted dehydrogenase